VTFSVDSSATRSISSIAFTFIAFPFVGSSGFLGL